MKKNIGSVKGSQILLLYNIHKLFANNFVYLSTYLSQGFGCTHIHTQVNK